MAEIVKNDKNFLIIKMNYEEASKCNFGMLPGLKDNIIICGSCNVICDESELYYIAGYILEGITVYSAYKLHHWNSSDDIQGRYNLAFSQRTNLDFYYARSRMDRITGEERVPSFFQNRPSGAMSVQGHKFQNIVMNLLKPDPSFNDVPYLGNGVIDRDVESLINNWSPNVRYYHSGQSNPLPNLDYDIINRLINTCQIIYINHI